MEETRKGRQTPTQGFVLPYQKTIGQEAIALYNSTGRTAQEWQELLIYDIEAVNEDGLWTHTKFGYSVPRRNGKNEIVSIREMHGLTRGERILHTAHRTTTSSSASRRLAMLLDAAGYTEVIRKKKDETYEKAYTYSKQLGLERITILDEGGGVCDFRTRSSKGGLGEGFDLLVIDEAQEYTDDQESALKYVVTDSKNPQTIFCGTPPTPVSSGTVFLKLRQLALSGGAENTGWAEWSVPTQSDVRDKELWYQCNPSLGTVFTERSVADEIGPDEIDFNIQRLGLWLRYNQKSAISETEWKELESRKLPKLTSRLYVGIKFGHQGDNVALAIAAKTASNKIFVEAIDCRSMREGIDWLLSFLRAADVAAVAVDGASGQEALKNAMKDCRLKAPILPTVPQIIAANAAFAEGVALKKLCHLGQPGVVEVVSNCQKRAIGSHGGFGYQALMEDLQIEILDSIVLAYWQAKEAKGKKKARVSC